MASQSLRFSALKIIFGFENLINTSAITALVEKLNTVIFPLLSNRFISNQGSEVKNLSNHRRTQSNTHGRARITDAPIYDLLGKGSAP